MVMSGTSGSPRRVASARRLGVGPGQWATVAAVGIGVCFSVLLMSVAAGVADDIKSRLKLPGLGAFGHLDVGRINTILTALTVVVTTAMLAQTGLATYTQGVQAMSRRQDEIALRRQSGVLRGRLIREFLWGAVASCIIGGLLGEIVGVAAGVALRSWTVLPVRFGWLELLGPFPITILVALAATFIPAWHFANASPALLRRD